MPRFRMTIRGMMVAVLAVALFLGFWSYLWNWKARRVVMYQQRDVTRSILSEAAEDLAAAGRPTSRFRQRGDHVTYTTHWTERLEEWDGRSVRGAPLIRAAVSGANGRFTIPPIAVETYDSPSKAPWLGRLLRAYREKGWEYKVVRRPNP